MSAHEKLEAVQDLGLPEWVADFGVDEIAELQEWAQTREDAVARAKLARNQAETTLASARSERDEARADHLRVRDECFATMEALADERRARDAARSEVEALRKDLDGWSEREAAVCPENVGFEEVIEALRVRTSAAEATAERLMGTLRNLLVWAEWIKAKIHRSPHMDEPNTGAILDARTALASSTGKTRQPLPRRVAKHLTGEDLKDAMRRLNPPPAPEDYEDEASTGKEPNDG